MTTSLNHAIVAYQRLNKLDVNSTDYRKALCELIPDFPESSFIVPPFYCDYGNGIHIGKNVVTNINCSMMDCADITIGDHTLIGPNRSFYTSQLPPNYLERSKPKETARPIVIGDDYLLGGNMTVIGKVFIGARSVFGAGSVVVKDIPEDCLAVGNPCRVIRKLR